MKQNNGMNITINYHFLLLFCYKRDYVKFLKVENDSLHTALIDSQVIHQNNQSRDQRKWAPSDFTIKQSVYTTRTLSSKVSRNILSPSGVYITTSYSNSVSSRSIKNNHNMSEP